MDITYNNSIILITNKMVLQIAEISTGNNNGSF